MEKILLKQNEKLKKLKKSIKLKEESKNKTLIGIDNHLFLVNDLCKEIEVHQNNLCLVKTDLNSRYDSIKNKFLITIFPNKSLVNKKYLPSIYDLKYRPNFDIYNDYFGDYLLDGYNIINNEIYYYKTDSHINFLGCYTIYCNFIEKVNNLFNLQLHKKIININKKECILSDLNLGLGDLTWDINLGNKILINKNDTYYYCDDNMYIYMNKIIKTEDKLRILKFENNILIDVTLDYNNLLLGWDILSNNILYNKNETNNKYKILIFYDSFLLPTLSFYLELFNEVYLCKSTINNNLIEYINPDYIFEFRVERFLF